MVGESARSVSEIKALVEQSIDGGGLLLHAPCRFGDFHAPCVAMSATGKVATYRHVYRPEPKEPAQFGSVSGSVIQNLPFSLSGIVSLYQSEPKEPT